MTKHIFVLLIFLVVSNTVAQKSKRVLKKLGDNPVYFIDSLNVNENEIKKYESSEIAAVTVVQNETAINLLGEEGKDGIIYIETKEFARQRYWKYFKTKSTEYAKLIPEPKTDSIVQYILNKKVLTENFEGSLSLIDDSVFKEIKIINTGTLKAKYNIFDKKIGVLIKSEKPENLHKARKKF